MKKMTKTLKQSLSILLAAVMVITSAPQTATSVLAAEVDAIEAEASEADVLETADVVDDVEGITEEGGNEAEDVDALDETGADAEETEADVESDEETDEIVSDDVVEIAEPLYEESTPSLEVNSNPLVLNVSDLETGDITTSGPLNGSIFNSVYDGSNKLTVASSTKSNEDSKKDGLTLSKCIKTNGTGSTTKRAVSFKPEKSGILTVYAVTGSSGTSRPIVLHDGTSEVTRFITGDDLKKFTQKVTQNDTNTTTYYLYSGDNGISMYYFALEYFPDSPVNLADANVKYIVDGKEETSVTYTGEEIDLGVKVIDTDGKEVDPKYYNVTYAVQTGDTTWSEFESAADITFKNAGKIKAKVVAKTAEENEYAPYYCTGTKECSDSETFEISKITLKTDELTVNLNKSGSSNDLGKSKTLNIAELFADEPDSGREYSLVTDGHGYNKGNVLEGEGDAPSISQSEGMLTYKVVSSDPGSEDPTVLVVKITSDNYNDAYLGITFKLVEKKVVTVKVKSATTAYNGEVYDFKENAVIASVTGDSIDEALAKEDIKSNLIYDFKLQGEADSVDPKDAGVYVVTAELDDASAYLLSENGILPSDDEVGAENVTLTISALTRKITPKNVAWRVGTRPLSSKTADTSDYTLDTPLLNDDTFSTQPTFAYKKTGTNDDMGEPDWEGLSNGSKVDIVASGAVAKNYEFTYEKGTVDVFSREITEPKVIDKDVSFTSDDIAVNVYNTDQTIKEYFVFTAESRDNNTFSVDTPSNPTVYNDKTYNNRLKSDGKGSAFYRSIKFTTSKAATLSIICMSANSNDSRQLVIATMNKYSEPEYVTGTYNLNGTDKTLSEDGIEIVAKTMSEISVKLPEAGTYYLYSNTNGGINFFEVGVTYDGGSDKETVDITPIISTTDVAKLPEGAKIYFTEGANKVEVPLTNNDASTATSVELKKGTEYTLKIEATSGSEPEDLAATINKSKTFTPSKNATVTIEIVDSSEVVETVAKPALYTEKGVEINTSKPLDVNTKVVLKTTTEGATLNYSVTKPGSTASSSTATESVTITLDTVGTWEISATATKDNMNASAAFSANITVQDNTGGDDDDDWLLQEDIAHFKEKYGKEPTDLWIAGIDDWDWEYTGNKIVLPVRVYNNTTPLTEKVDYTIAYKNNINATKADTPAAKLPTITVTGKGNYSGKATETFTISPLNIETYGDDIYYHDTSVEDNLVLYATGKAQKPVPAVTCLMDPQYDSFEGTRKLKNKTDFTVTYYKADDAGKTESDSVTDAGEYKIKVKGNGNYTGTQEVNLKLVDKSEYTLVSKLSIKAAAVNYDAEAAKTSDGITTTVTVKNGKAELVKGTDYDLEYEGNHSSGTGYVIVSALEGSKLIGSKRVSFKINGTAISKAKFSVKAAYANTTSADYVNWMDDETLDADFNGTALELGTDYEVYSWDQSKGKVTITIHGIGAYSGTVKKTFKLNLCELNEETGVGAKFDYDYDDSQTFSKAGLKPSITITYLPEDYELELGRDYTVSYKNNKAVAKKDAGKKAPTIVIKGKGDFKGTINKTFDIDPKALDEVEFSMPDMVQNAGGKYAGKPVLTDGGVKLTAGKDYEKKLTYTVNGEEIDANKYTAAEAGKTTIKVEAKAVEGGSYKGTISAEYEIRELDFSKAKVKLAAGVKKYYQDGTPVTLGKDDLVVTVGTATLDLVDDVDSETDGYAIVGYTNNNKKGSAKVTVKGTGKYAGTKTISFKIQAQPIKLFTK